jgi:hypothetical protein
MSFLRGRSPRPDQRGGKGSAERRADSGYDDYDYAPDGYQQDDDNWSPDEYFSPEGIKGRWAAGTRPGERSAAADRPGDRSAGRRDAGYDNYGPGPGQGRTRGSGGPGGAGGSGGPGGPGSAGGSAGRYGRDSYGSDDRYGGGYGAAGYGPDGYGPDGYGPDGYGAGAGEYGTDEYGSGAYEVPEGADDRGGRGGGRKRRDRGDRRLRLGRRDKGEDIWPDDGVSDEDYWASVASDRPLNSAGPGLDADPMNVVNNRPMARPSGSGAARPAGDSRDSRPKAERPFGSGEVRLPGDAPSGAGRLGPAPGLVSYPSGSQPRSNSGPMARASTGPTPTRPATGPTPTRAGTGPTAARHGTGPAAARPGTGPSGAIGSTPARPAAGLAQPGYTQPGPSQPALPSFQPHATRGSSRQQELPDWNERTERIERIPAAGYPDPRLSGRSQSTGRGADDDPLTSKAYSREALVNTDGRSYRAAASRRSAPSGDRYEAALTEQTQAFTMTGQYPADPQSQTGSYPVRGGQQPGHQSGPQPTQRPGQRGSHPHSRHSAQQRTPLPPSDGHGGGQGSVPSGPRSPYDR